MITFCIPSKSNLRYLKTCITSIRDNSYHKDNEVIVFVDEDKDGTVEWLKQNEIKHIVNPNPEPMGIGHAYDTMFKAAKHELVVAFHADMVLGHHADYWMLYYKKKDNVVCATRIEPPLHPPGSEKIIADFGMWPEDINMEEFNEEVKNFIHNFRVTKGMFAPWMIEKSQHLGHDPIFKSVYEDADLFRRFVLAGYKMVQTWDAVVYHFTCRGGQFAGAEKMEDFQRKDEKWMHNNSVSMAEYIRKWGGLFNEYGPCEPKPNKKYDCGLEAKNCADHVFRLEPWFDNLSVDRDESDYVSSIQPNTTFDLKSKFKRELQNDIVFCVDFSNPAVHDKLWQLVTNREDVLSEIKEPGNYEFDGILVRVNKLEVKNPKIKLKW